VILISSPSLFFTSKERPTERCALVRRAPCDPEPSLPSSPLSPSSGEPPRLPTGFRLDRCGTTPAPASLGAPPPPQPGVLDGRPPPPPPLEPPPVHAAALVGFIAARATF
jgi:hypothetical protein